MYSEPRDWRIQGFLEGNFEGSSIVSTAHRPAGADLLIQSLDLSRIRTLHIHDTVQMVRVHHALEIQGHRKRIKLVLTSHTPELPGVERATEYRDRGVSKSLVNGFEDMHVRVDERAFSVADALVFPSKEAAEPYLGRFGSIINDKEVRYVLFDRGAPDTSCSTNFFWPRRDA